MNRSYRQLNPIVHQPARLSIMAALAVAREVEFSVIRDTIQISDSLLSRYTTILDEAGYLKVRKTFVNKRPKTWLSLTPKGEAAFAQYKEALQRIVDQSTNN